jgi:hypothetical protein
VLCVLAAPVAALALGLAPGAQAAETGRITGRVTDASTQLAIEGIEVCAYATSAMGIEGIFEGIGCATTQANGEYAISGLASGEYEVEFSSPLGSGLNYVTQYYDGKSAESEATEVAVATGSTASEIDAQLEAGGRIVGRVTDASTHAAIQDIEVCAFQAMVFLHPLGTAITGATGEDEISAMAGGEYKGGCRD